MQSDYARQYEELWRTHWWWRARKQFVLARLRHLLNPTSHTRDPKSAPTKILDIGCGNGLFFSDLQKLGPVAGIEPDPLLVAPDGPFRSQIDVRGFDATYQPPTGQNPDLVLMLDVLEHIPDDLAAARHVHNILTPGGHFLLTVPALMSLWSAHDDANLHYRRYTKATLRRLLQAAGFHIESIHYFFGWTLAPLLLRRTLSPGHPPVPGAPPQPPPTGEYRVQVPPALINSTFYALSRVEQSLFGWCGLPLGSSLIAVAKQNP